MPKRNRKINLLDLQKMKIENKPVSWITSYDLPFAYAAEQAGIDMILVGDSGGMVQLGYKTTNPVTMDEMIVLAKAARRGAPDTFLIGDMSQGSYEVSDEEAVRNALRFIKEADCDAVKLEGGLRVTSRVKAIHDAGILVMGHLGLTPQSAASFGGYRVQGKTPENLSEIIEDAKELESAGCFSILLEAMPGISSLVVSTNLQIPIYGIGAGWGVDGQLVIMHDLMGFYQKFRPWFAKCYIPEVLEQFSNHITDLIDIRENGRKERNDGLLVLAQMAIEKYVQDVKDRSFPGEEYSYQIKDEELEELKNMKLTSNHSYKVEWPNDENCYVENTTFTDIEDTIILKFKPILTFEDYLKSLEKKEKTSKCSYRQINGL